VSFCAFGLKGRELKAEGWNCSLKIWKK